METPDVKVETGRTFWAGSSGVWAGQKLMDAISNGGEANFRAQALRVCDTLQKDEWKFFDTTLVESAALRLRGVADLLSAGLTVTVPNSFGKTVYEYEQVGDWSAAQVSMDGMVNTDNDRVEFTLAGLPLPITHKDFWINLRTLVASRTRGEALDTLQIRLAGRKIAEATEDMLFNGGRKWGGYTIYGYRTHPNRNIASFSGGLAWDNAAKTGDQRLTDVGTMISKLEADGYTSGPYWLYLPPDASFGLDSDFKTASDRTVRERLLAVDRLQKISFSDKLATGQAIMIQATPDVVVMVNGEPLQTIQWDVNGGMQINFKAMQISVPLIRSDYSTNVGVVHMS